MKSLIPVLMSSLVFSTHANALEYICTAESNNGTLLKTFKKISDEFTSETLQTYKDGNTYETEDVFSEKQIFENPRTISFVDSGHYVGIGVDVIDKTDGGYTNAVIWGGKETYKGIDLQKHVLSYGTCILRE